MDTREVRVEMVRADHSHEARLVTLLAVALDRYLTERPPTVDLSGDLRVYPDVPDNAKDPTS
jgi:hypothetical protein